MLIVEKRLSEIKFISKGKELDFEAIVIHTGKEIAKLASGLKDKKFIINNFACSLDEKRKVHLCWAEGVIYLMTDMATGYVFYNPVDCLVWLTKEQE